MSIMRKKERIMKIFMSAFLAMFLLGCSGENKQSAQESAAENKESIAQSVKEVKSEAIKAAQEEATPKVEEIKAEAAAKVQEAQTAVAIVQVDGAKLFQVCAGCHGADASKAALGKSQIIKGWSADKIKEALNGYKAGTYGGAMKGMMAGQVSKLNDEQIEALAKYISTL